jgi:hypothetical protein
MVSPDLFKDLLIHSCPQLSEVSLLRFESYNFLSLNHYYDSNVVVIIMVE